MNIQVEKYPSSHITLYFPFYSVFDCIRKYIEKKNDKKLLDSKESGLVAIASLQEY